MSPYGGGLRGRLMKRESDKLRMRRKRGGLKTVRCLKRCGVKDEDHRCFLGQDHPGRCRYIETCQKEKAPIYGVET